MKLSMPLSYAGGFAESARQVASAPIAGAAAPLATRLRPRTLDEFVGQGRLLEAGSALRRAAADGTRSRPGAARIPNDR